MGKRKRRRFTPQQNARAVEIVRTSGKSVSEVARELDLTASALGAWVEQAEIDEGKGPAGATTTVYDRSSRHPNIDGTGRGSASSAPAFH